MTIGQVLPEAVESPLAPEAQARLVLVLFLLRISLISAADGLGVRPKLDRHVGQVDPTVVDPFEGELLAGETRKTLPRQPNFQRLERRYQHVDS